MLGIEQRFAERGCGGIIRSSNSDFYVEEILPYEFTGSGEFTAIKIEKQSLSTIQARNEIARNLGISKWDVSYAGLKDTKAVAVQHMSIHNMPSGRLEKFSHGKIKILEAHKHARKIKIGKLYANKFRIIIRDCSPGIGINNFQVLMRKGVPNVFGWQRFGGREGNTHTAGECVIKKQYKEALDSIVSGVNGEKAMQMQEEYKKQNYFNAANLMPRRNQTERKILGMLAKGKDPKECIRSIDKGLRWLYISAYQAKIFNSILNERMKSGLEIQEGDLVKKYYGLECSSGLFPGIKTPIAGGGQGEIERAVLEKNDIDLEDFSYERVRGKRRANLFPLLNAGCKELDKATLELEFTIPKGCFATAVLREVMGTDVE